MGPKQGDDCVGLKCSSQGTNAVKWRNRTVVGAKERMSEMELSVNQL